jgi:hypothetical protein
MIKTREEQRYDAILQAVRERKLAVGRKMPNEGIILMHSLIAEHEWANEYMVLAIVEGQFQPFVTWRRTIGVEQKADGSYGPIEYCWSGGYHRRLSDAIDDFVRRVEENGGEIDESTPSTRTAVDQV